MGKEELLRDALKTYIDIYKSFVALAPAISVAFVTVAQFFGEEGFRGLTLAVLLFSGASILLGGSRDFLLRGARRRRIFSGLDPWSFPSIDSGLWFRDRSFDRNACPRAIRRTSGKLECRPPDRRIRLTRNHSYPLDSRRDRIQCFCFVRGVVERKVSEPTQSTSMSH